MLSAKIIRQLSHHGLTLAVAESCTGGGIANTLTDVAGASEVFMGGVVVYTPQAKIKLLRLQDRDLPIGCIGAELSQKMAVAIRTQLKSHLGLGITGALGPTSPATVQIGDVYIAVAAPTKQVVQKFHFPGDRQKVKAEAIAAACRLLLSCIERWYGV